jgi:hypothetical protein
MKAVELMNEEHPLHDMFLKFLNGKSPTKRQARKFLQQNPNYREAQEA